MRTPAHSLLGASGAHRWLNCPGSFQLSLSAPSRPASIYAATGTLAHDYIEKVLRSTGTSVDPAELGTEHIVESQRVTVDEDFIGGVNTMLRYTLDAAALSDWMRCEFRVELDGYFPPAEPPPVPLFGRVDVALLDLQTSTLEVVDYKNGAGVMVTPKENPQMLYYAAGVLAQLPDNQLRALNTVRLTVVQPHAQGTAPIRSWETTVLDLLMWVDDVLVPGVRACAEDQPALNPGSWCRFCPALHSCPRLMQDAIAMAKHEFDDVLPDDPAELARQLDIADRAVTWAHAVQAYALEQMKSQMRVPGWELVPTRPTRQWVNEDTMTASLLALTGIEDAVIWETRLRSPAQVAKRLPARVWDALSDKLVHSVSSGVKLARRDRPDPEKDFANADGV